MYINRAQIFGNLTRDPESRELPGGGMVANFSVATNRTYKTATGERKEEVEFHSVVVFGKQAESCAQYLKRGDQAYVEGRIQTRSWEKDGQKVYRTEIVGERVQWIRKGEKTVDNTPEVDLADIGF